MNGSSLIFLVMPVMTPIALLTCIALPLITDRRSGHSYVPVEYLYVPCVYTSSDDHSAWTRRWVQEVPIVKKTAKWIYYTSETWDRREAVVSPGCISREQFETDGVIPIPGDRHLPGPAGGLFFATPEAAQAELHRTDRGRAEPAGRGAPRIKELRRAMADAHPDRGGTAQKFIQARRRYEAALRSARR